MNRNQQRDRPPRTAEPDLEKTEMSFTKEPSFNFSLLEDGIESTFRFEDVGNVPGILNEVGDTGSNKSILFNEAGESVGTSFVEFELVEQLTDGAFLAEIENIFDFGEGNTITVAGSLNVEQFEALQPAQLEIASGEGIFDGAEGEATLTQAELNVLDAIEVDLSIKSNSSIESNPFTDYFDPFLGVYLPARGEQPVLSDSEDGYTVDDLFVFGDRLTENGGEFGKNAVAQSTGANPPYDEAPYSPLGNFTNDLNWTTYLESILGVEGDAEQDTNFSYLDATARELENPVDPFGQATELNTFAGQIDTFEETYGSFTADDLVVVNFGGNDLTLPSEESVQQSIQATINGIAELQELGAENFLVGLVPPVELAPIFSDREFLNLLGVEPGFFDPVIEEYNQNLTTALEAYEAESGANIEILDLNGLFDSIAANPGAYGFVNVDEPVLSSQTPVTGEPIEYNEAIDGENPAVQDETLFIDPFFHPTALGHSIIAQTASEQLFDLGEAVPEPTLEETGLTVGLYDTHEDTLIAPLENGIQINASDIAGKSLTISASVPEDSVYSEVESVFLNLNDGQVTRTENVNPYAIFGDIDGEYFQGEIGLQEENTIVLELYSQDNLGGEMVGNINVDFSIAKHL